MSGPLAMDHRYCIRSPNFGHKTKELWPTVLAFRAQVLQLQAVGQLGPRDLESRAKNASTCLNSKKLFRFKQVVGFARWHFFPGPSNLESVDLFFMANGFFMVMMMLMLMLTGTSATTSTNVLVIMG